MRNKPKPLLSQPGENSFDVNWLFLFEKRCLRSIREDWRSEVLFYELCRELSPGNNNEWDPTAFLRKISDGQFPETPFLLLDKALQESCVEEMKSSESFYDTHVRFLEESQRIFDYQIEQVLKDEYIAFLEDAAFEAADEESAKREGSTARDFMPLTNPGERAASAIKSRLSVEGDQVFEPSRCNVTLYLDLDFPDTAIRQEFAKLLGHIRTRYPSPGNDRRGKVKGLHSPFQQLAAYRLKRDFGSFKQIENVAIGKNFAESPITTESGWNKVVKKGMRMVEEFRERWQGAAPKDEREVENSEPESG